MGALNDFWLSILAGVIFGGIVGFFLGLASNGVTELVARSNLHDAASQLVGTWTAHNIHGRDVDQEIMKGSGDTVVRLKARSRFTREAGVLDFDSVDHPENAPKRHHSGRIVMHPNVPWVATRIDRYHDSNEVAYQTLVIDESGIVFVFPDPAKSSLGDSYNKHAWRPKK